MKFDEMLILGEKNSNPNVSKMLANPKGLSGRPYRSRTCDTLIKSL